jgi:predicted AlkP superfamily phosphohydrolase/phosphomutase
MDPGFVEQHWAALPNLSRLRMQGGFQRLKTTTPPQSPVAWSTFATGRDPAAHGIFDFVHRDPSTLQPFSSMSQTEESKFALSIGPYSIPLTPAHVRLLRKGKTFWEILAAQDIPVTVIRMPVNYPPIEAGEALAGMGTPDLRGTLGTFTFYTDDPAEISRSVSGGRIVKVPAFNNRVTLKVEGPPNSLLKEHPFTFVDVVADIDPVAPVARLTAGSAQAVVRQGEWSGWLPVEFPLLRGIAGARGMFRVYAKQLHPTFELYISPVNLDPRAPSLPISAPSDYSREIASETGPFYTLGISEDTSALRQGVFDLPEFLTQSRLVFQDELDLLHYSLRHFHGGLLFFYFSAIDQNSHMLWGKHDDELLPIYQRIDAAIGEVMNTVKDADLIVMSDHGFARFDRAVNLNTWLWKQGYLALKGPPGGDDELFANVDWSKTQLYALGLNGLYLNLAGREKYGIVKRGPESQAILANVTAQLRSLRDSVDGRQVVGTVHAMPVDGGPDMIVGYAPGYRASWQTALGGVPENVLDDNTDAWIADHCINADDVPGVLFSNRKLLGENAELKDLTVSILGLFGVSPGAGMTGKVVF